MLLGCWDGDYSWQFCCDILFDIRGYAARALGGAEVALPAGNAQCFPPGAEFDFRSCCTLSPRNGTAARLQVLPRLTFYQPKVFIHLLALDAVIPVYQDAWVNRDGVDNVGDTWRGRELSPDRRL